MTEKINKLYPNKKLNVWLRLHKKWNHHHWLSMLDKLTKLSFHQSNVSVTGQKGIGFYLEVNRRCDSILKRC